MQVTINGKTTEIIPYQLSNNLAITRDKNKIIGATSNDPGSINVDRHYFANITDFTSLGTYISLKGVFNDVYHEGYSQTFQTDWEDMFTWSYVDEGGETQESTYQSRITHNANDTYLVFESRQGDQGTPQSFKIDYASDQYNYDYLWSLAVVDNYNAEYALGEYDTPIFNFEDNGLQYVTTISGAYLMGYEWRYGTLEQDAEWHMTGMPTGYPLYTGTDITEVVPYVVEPHPSHRIYNLNSQVWDLAEFPGLQFNGVDPEDLPAPDKDADTDTNSPSGPPKGPYKDRSDRISGPGLPQTSALSAGFIKAYVLTSAQASALSNYMLSDDFIDNVKKLMANPIDYIVGMHMVPVEPASVAHNIIVGGVDTEIGASMVTNEYVNFSCGSVQLAEYWGNFIDYTGCKVEIYLPFIGTCPLAIDDVMNATLTLEYNINTLSGACTAFLFCDTARTLHSATYYWNGNMQSQIPITNTDYTNKVNAAIGAVGNLISLGMTGNPGNAVGAVSNIAEATLRKPTIQKSGTLAGDVGMLSQFTPFLIITRPVQALPSNYRTLKGNTSQIGGTIGSFSGYLECSDVKLNGIACTDAERDEILQLLEEGVFV